MEDISISLSEALWRFVDEQIEAAGLPGRDEYVIGLIQRDMERQGLRAMLVAGKKSSPARIADDAYFDEMRRRISAG